MKILNPRSALIVDEIRYNLDSVIEKKYNNKVADKVMQACEVVLRLSRLNVWGSVWYSGVRESDWYEFYSNIGRTLHHADGGDEQEPVDLGQSTAFARQW